MAPRTRAVVGMNSAQAGELSYANNSHFQRMIACVTEKERQEMAAALYRARRPAAMAIADLGCGTGPNALLMASDAIQGVLSEYDQLLAGDDDDEAVPDPEFHVFLNDLPTNDFNSVFRLLPDPTALAGHRCFLSAWPGSFYGRIFPAASLDYVVSSSSLHFLSKAPAMMPGIRNKGRIYVSEHSPPAVLHVYRTQFHADFSLFLSCRADELRHGGLLLLTFVARRTNLPSQHDCYLWDLLAVALMEMAAAGEGLVDEDKVNGFDVPYYAPCPEELTKVIHEEGSFTVRRLHLFETSRRCFSSRDDDAAGDVDDVCVSRRLAKETASTVRAVLEPMLGRHFGWDAMDDLFRRYLFLLEAYYRSGKVDDLTNVFIALEKNQST